MSWPAPCSSRSRRRRRRPTRTRWSGAMAWIVSASCPVISSVIAPPSSDITSSSVGSCDSTETAVSSILLEFIRGTARLSAGGARNISAAGASSRLGAGAVSSIGAAVDQGGESTVAIVEERREPFIRQDGKDKVTGLGRYTADLTLTGMLHARVPVRRSPPRPRAARRHEPGARRCPACSRCSRRTTSPTSATAASSRTARCSPATSCASRARSSRRSPRSRPRSPSAPSS